MVDRMISPFTLTAGPVLFVLAIVLLSEFVVWSDYLVTVAIYFLWILFSRSVRMAPHFWRVPGARPSTAVSSCVLAPALRPAVVCLSSSARAHYAEMRC